MLMKSYSIPYDRNALLCKGFVNTAVMIGIFLLTCIFPLNPLFVFLMFTVCWFTGRAGTRAWYRLIKNKPLCVLNNKDIEIAMPSGDARVMMIKDIDFVELKESTYYVRMLIHGKNVDHPSGIYMINMYYPFSKKEYKYNKDVLYKWLDKHNINKVFFENQQEKKVNVSV